MSVKAKICEIIHNWHEVWASIVIAGDSFPQFSSYEEYR